MVEDAQSDQRPVSILRRSTQCHSDSGTNDPMWGSFVYNGSKWVDAESFGLRFDQSVLTNAVQIVDNLIRFLRKLT